MILKYARHTMIVQQVVAFQRLDGLPGGRAFSSGVRPVFFERKLSAIERY